MFQEVPLAAPRVCLSGEPEKRYHSASSGATGGIPGQSFMPAAIAFLKNRVGFTATVEGRFAAVLAANPYCGLQCWGGPPTAPIGEARRTSTGGVQNSELMMSATEEPKALDSRSDTPRPSSLCPVAVGGGRCRLLE